MNKDVTFTVKHQRFDESYRPSSHTRITTNFANLARGAQREENLRNTLAMIDNRFNALAHWDNASGDRYSVELEIVSVDIDVKGNGETFPSIEVLKTNIVDTHTQKRIEGIVGNNFSSYVRDYDFSIVLSDYNKGQPKFAIPENFGELHGKIFKHFVNSDVYQTHFKKPPVICLSVSENKTYHRTENRHPVLGIEYQPDSSSLTEMYFNKMGLKVRRKKNEKKGESAQSYLARMPWVSSLSRELAKFCLSRWENALGPPVCSPLERKVSIKSRMVSAARIEDLSYSSPRVLMALAFFASKSAANGMSLVTTRSPGCTFSTI